MRIAALDLGSNTTILLVCDVEDGRITHVVRDETTVTRMGQGVHEARAFHPDALWRVDQALAAYAEFIRADGCERTIAVATSAARDVANADELIALGAKHGIPIHIIDGEREAALTYRGAPGNLPANGARVVDVGGGSTEVIRPLEDGSVRGFSVDVGSVRLSELFGGDLGAIREYATAAFARAQIRADARERATGAAVIAVAGTPTTLAAIDRGQAFDESFVHGYVLTRRRIEDWVAKLAAMTLAQREQLPGMQAKRADVIVCGAVILSSALGALGADRVVVSTRGVRYGVALSHGDFA